MNDALGVDELVQGLKGKGIGVDGKFKIRSINPKLTAAGLTQKREAFARLANYMADEDKDLPRVNPKDVDPKAIQEKLLNMSYNIEQPRYDDKTIPKDTLEAMFAQDFAKSSGNVNTDNQMVDYIKSTMVNQEAVEIDQAARDEEADQAGITDDMELADVGQAVNNNQQPMIAPATGQVDANQFQALFPNDPTGAAIAQRGVKRG